MALAFLCQQLVKERLASYLTFEAFIVDHNARPGSGEEAQRVSAWLRDLGILHQGRPSLLADVVSRYQVAYLDLALASRQTTLCDV